MARNNDDASSISSTAAVTAAAPEQASRRQQQRQQQRQRRRIAARMGAPWEVFAEGGAASNAIELLDDDDDDDNGDGDGDDMGVKPAAVENGNDRKRKSAPKKISASPVRDGEVEVLEERPNFIGNNNRKPPPGNNNRKPPPGAAAEAMELKQETISSPILRVLEIFPDADVDYIKKKLKEQSNDIEIVVAVLSESDNYPKQKNAISLDDTPDAKNKHKHKNKSNTIIQGMKYMEPKHDYSSPTCSSFKPSQQYHSEVIDLLMFDFCFLKKIAVRTLLSQNQGRYTLTRNNIHDAILGKSPNDNVNANDGNKVAAAAVGSDAAAKAENEENQHYQILRAILIRGSVPKDVRERMQGGNGKSTLMKKLYLQKPRKKIGERCPVITDPILRDEHHHYDLKFQQWLDTIKNRLRCQAANKFALENGSAVQCACCFDDVAESECVPCKEKGHLFCKDCIVQYVESQVFGSGNLGIDKETKKPALEIKCCEGSGCNSGFRDELLQKVLSQKIWVKYSELQATAQIQQAGLGENLAMCPKCGYQAEVAETQNIFECPVEECQFVSCRKCDKASHIPLRCDEVVQKNRQDEGRLKIEEALSEAKMRTCPKCSKKFIKSDGCNKMTCACGMKLCYVCRAPLDKIKGNVYTHFCQVPHCDHSSCGKCKMYTKDDEDDAQAMREAGIAAKEEFEAKLQKEDGVDGAAAAATADLQLDIDQMMHDPSRPEQRKKRRRQQNPHRQPQRQHGAAAHLAGPREQMQYDLLLLQRARRQQQRDQQRAFRMQQNEQQRAQQMGNIPGGVRQQLQRLQQMMEEPDADMNDAMAALSS